MYEIYGLEEAVDRHLNNSHVIILSLIYIRRYLIQMPESGGTTEVDIFGRMLFHHDNYI